MPPAIIPLLTTPPAARGEHLTPLLAGTGFRLEHIASHGTASPPGFWSDQDQPEWVMLVRGEATLGFAPHETVVLRAGDSLTIPAHCRHRVETVSADAVWLALHFTPAKK